MKDCKEMWSQSTILQPLAPDLVYSVRCHYNLILRFIPRTSFLEPRTFIHL